MRSLFSRSRNQPPPIQQQQPSLQPPLQQSRFVDSSNNLSSLPQGKVKPYKDREYANVQTPHTSSRRPSQIQRDETAIANKNIEQIRRKKSILNIQNQPRHESISYGRSIGRGEHTGHTGHIGRANHDINVNHHRR